MTDFTARARHTDPNSSIQAARTVEANGTIQDQLARTLAAVHAFPGLSSRALADKAQMGVEGRFIIARRLPELERKLRVIRGAEEPCTVSGRAAVTWWPV